MLLCAVANVYALDEKVTIEGAFYGSGTTWTDVTESTIQTVLASEGNMVFNIRDAIKDDSLFSTRSSLIVLLKFREKCLVFYSPKEPFSIVVTPEKLVSEYDALSELTSLKGGSVEVYAAIYGAGSEWRSATKQMAKYFTGGRLTAEVDHNEYGFAPGGDRALVVFYKKFGEKAVQVKAALERDGKKLTLQ